MCVDTINISGCTDSYCEGSHGLSVGSVGDGGQVADVHRERTGREHNHGKFSCR